MQGYDRTILSQYAESAVMGALLDAFNSALDPSAQIQALVDMVINVQTATGWGLQVWGRIVGVGNVLKLSAATYLGFSQASDPGEGNFSNSILFNGQAATTNYVLSDDNYRVLILAKGLYNITDCSILSINRILMLLFGSYGQCYCTNGMNMTMTYTFDFDLTPVQFAIITQSGVLPAPAGVSVSVVQGA